ncbi:hypothetical protein [Ralstonia wenshanensis]|uniref:Uncharacterized protein n=1 Tax=Ralstonia wenshanensis TaxID=2842456 RepID=A0AAD2BCF3_9RALS|nr:hypothetical protein [Ralstonia wenshanensis]CAJ0707987.1 hypothetical protein LMG18091_05106 [Ralstonia wenshanensis]
MVALAALRLDFHGVTKALRVKPTGIGHPRLQKVKLTDETTVEDVRLDLLERLSQRARRHGAGMWQYWFLRIIDADWMAQQFPYTLRAKMPTISEDRRKIERFFAKQIELASAGKVASRNDTPACLRARVRDFDWWSEQRTRFDSERRIARRASRESVYSSRVTTIEEAIAMLLTREGRPAMINCTTLANSTRLSKRQVHEVIRQHPLLRHAIEKANDGLPRLQLHWAANQLLNEGKHLSLSSMAQRGGIKRKHFARLADEAKRIIAASA